MADERHRVEVRLPAELVKKIDEVAFGLGVGRSGFIAIASASLAADLVGLYKPGVKRRQLLDYLERSLESSLERARRNA